MKHKLFTPLGLSWVIFLTFLFQASVYANIVCLNPNPNSPGQLSPASDCMAEINDLLFEGNGSTCDGPYQIVVRTYLSFDTIGVGVNSVMVDLSAYLGMIIEIEATDLDDNVSCSSFYLVEDKQAPIISSCPSDTVFCTASLDPANIKPIVYSDNCTVDPTVTFVDDTVGINCGFTPSMFIGRVDRMYSVTDDQDSVTTCVQEIYITRPVAADVVIPADITIDCDEEATYALTGQPTIDGDPIVSDGLCSFAMTVTDDTTMIGPGCADAIIRRTWLLNDCNSATVMDSTQLIFVEDMDAPIFTCPTLSPVLTMPGTCVASVTLPQPSIIQDCSSVTISASLGNLGNGFSYPAVPAGSYTVTYTGTDGCGHAADCQSVLTVIDDETPTAVCDGVVIVAIPSSGVAVLPASEFDDGSTDNCGGTNLSFMVSKDGGPFMPTIEFTCDDVGPDTVMVTLQVTENMPPNASNTCMNQVVVQDKLSPIINCPGDLTIDCEEDYSELSVFGAPIVFDGCGFDLVEVDTIEIDQCGTGFITRTFTATDPSGNSNSCTQTILVENQTPFDGTGIVYPLDTTIVDGGCITEDDLEPGDLPPGYNEPILPSLNCAMLAISSSDQIFYFDYPACYKIVRTWTVMDMCQFNPSNPGVGIWTDQQVIAVMDTNPPTIDFCPPADTFGLTANCGPATVTLMPVMASGLCPNEDIVITNDSPYGDPGNPGSDASGVYPEGEHTITFTVADGCGNEVTCSTTILVADLKKPTPYCTSGTVAELQAMPNVPIMALVTAEHLNFNSFDNCTAAEDLLFQIRIKDSMDTLASSLTFGCDDIGENEVEIWVTDESGNSDFCVTTIIIQDNMDLCPDPLSAGAVGGVVLTTMGAELPDVHVEIPNMAMEEMTDEVGDYVFYDLEVGNTYSFEPWKNDDPLNGITTFDILLMTKHVLNTEPLTDPYKLIAADVNNSGSVTTGDILELRKLVLHIYDEFPNNSSWRFVRADYVFPNPIDPFTPAYPEHYYLPNHDDEDVMDADFIAVKIGDLNGSASVNFSGSNLGDRSGGETTFLLEDREIAAGDVFEVPFRLSEIRNLHALQFTLEFETDLELQGIEKDVLPGVTGDRFETARLSQANAVTGLWYHTTPVMVNPESVLFSLRFRARRAGRLAELLRITSTFTEALAYNDAGMEQDLKLSFENSSTMAFQLHQNQPNPFKKLTNIGFTLPQAGPAKLTIYDMSGSVLHTWEQNCEQGFNQVSVQRSELPSGGVLYYQLETTNNTATRKMILLQ